MATYQCHASIVPIHGSAAEANFSSGGRRRPWYRITTPSTAEAASVAAKRIARSFTFVHPFGTVRSPHVTSFGGLANLTRGLTLSHGTTLLVFDLRGAQAADLALMEMVLPVILFARCGDTGTRSQGGQTDASRPVGHSWAGRNDSQLRRDALPRV